MKTIPAQIIRGGGKPNMPCNLEVLDDNQTTETPPTPELRKSIEGLRDALFSSFYKHEPPRMT